MTFGD